MFKFIILWYFDCELLLFALFLILLPLIYYKIDDKYCLRDLFIVVKTSDGSRSIFCHPSLIWVWKISPKNLNFFPFRSRKISLSRVKKYPGQMQDGLLFTAGQKYSRFGSGPISSQNHYLFMKIDTWFGSNTNPF